MYPEWASQARHRDGCPQSRNRFAELGPAELVDLYVERDGAWLLDVNGSLEKRVQPCHYFCDMTPTGNSARLAIRLDLRDLDASPGIQAELIPVLEALFRRNLPFLEKNLRRLNRF